jgi:cytochrome c6
MQKGDGMKKIIVTAVVIVAGTMVPFGASPAAEQAGETLFKQHCMACHPGGSNIINPKKTLQKNVREANNIKTANDIIKLMRNPGPGMTEFDKNTISDKSAKEIAEYVLKTFK